MGAEYIAESKLEQHDDAMSGLALIRPMSEWRVAVATAGGFTNPKLHNMFIYFRLGLAPQTLIEHPGCYVERSLGILWLTPQALSPDGVSWCYLKVTKGLPA